MVSERTRDGGILMGGFGRDVNLDPLPPYSAILCKFDSVGHHIWSRQLQSDVTFTFTIEAISELTDGSIIVSGWHDNILSQPDADLFICKLTSTGDIVWFNTFHSTNITCSNGNIRFLSLAEGINGELLFTGTNINCPLPKQLVAFKLNSAGAIQWKYTFNGQDQDGYGVGIFYTNGEVTLVNRPNTSDNDVHIDFLKLDYSTGNLISYKGWRPNIASAINYHLLASRTKARILNNGHYCIYGTTLGTFNPFPNVQAPRYAVLEFDGNYDFVNGFGIVTPGMGNSDADEIKVDGDKRVLFCMFNNNLPYPSVDEYIGSIVNGQVVSQRKKEFRNSEIFLPRMELFGDGSYVVINTLATMGQSSFWLDYSHLHNADTASTCLGLKANFATIQNMPYIPYNFNWQSITTNPMVADNNQNNSSTPISFTETIPCIQKARCDTLKIHGISAACDYQQDFTFTSFKRQECGMTVTWSIDPSVLQTFQIINDTTVKIRLNQPWQGWLYASLPTSCGVVKDSLLITITPSPGPVNLGPDQQLCAGNSITLNAHRGYASYLWNTGWTDSTIVVTTPGKYYVDVTDACGNISNDTIMITPAPPVPVNIGADRIKCNQDTIHIDAPPGFLNYTWGPNYFINTVTGQHVIVQPPIDTVYYVKAEQSAGCYGYHTIRVKARYSTPIQLGSDKSICSGDSVVLDAGAGFVQYAWSTGNTGQSIKVFNTGQYFVTATDGNGCISRDTLNILNVWPKPVVQLDKTPSLCEGSARVLNAGSFTSYQWQDGSSQPTFNATTAGTYYVTVIDNHACKGSDTTHILEVYSNPKDFITGSTEICNYGTQVLSTSSNYNSYLWNTNSTAKSLTISQPGIYWLQVIDNNNCIGKDTIVVTLKDCLHGFYVPSAFTPNNDGRNDLFKPIIGGNVKQYEFAIYSRWGEKVFSSKKINEGWDGKYKGVLQDGNVFVWICRYQLEGEELKFEKGTFVVIR